MDGSPVHLPVSGPEFAAWRRFYGRCPFGPLRGDLQAGVVARYVMRAAGRRPPSLDDCVIRVERKDAKRPPSLRMSTDAMEILAAALGVRFQRGGQPDDRQPGREAHRRER